MAWWHNGIWSPIVTIFGLRVSCGFDPRNSGQIGARWIRNRRMGVDKWMVTLGFIFFFLIFSRAHENDRTF